MDDTVVTSKQTRRIEHDDHTSKNVAKQLDYILVDRKHFSRSRDAEANDTKDMHVK